MTTPRRPSLLERFRIRTTTVATPRVHDDGDSRCLRFNGGVLQSSMRRADPQALVLSYTRAMMGFLLFEPDPREVLIIGLGGGSLSKFCHYALPAARITSVEIDPGVIALRDAFAIPPDGERFRVIAADGSEYLQRGDVTADVILLDGYDADGLPAALCSLSFYTRCRQTLGADGVLAVNLWGGEPKRAAYLDRLRTVFDDRVWWSCPSGSSSWIVYAAVQGLPTANVLRTRAAACDSRFALGLERVADHLLNPPALEQ